MSRASGRSSGRRGSPRRGRRILDVDGSAVSVVAHAADHPPSWQGRPRRAAARRASPRVDAMPLVLLVRHGRTAANAGGMLAGWTPGVTLDERGREQATPSPTGCGPSRSRSSSPAPWNAPARRPRRSSPAGPRPAPRVDDRVGECRYGDWTGQELKTLAKDPLWRVVQAHPSRGGLPRRGEAMAEMQPRAVAAVRDWNAAAASTDPTPVRGGVPRRHHQGDRRRCPRPAPRPASSASRWTPARSPPSVHRPRPFVLRLNDVGGGVDACPPRRREEPRAGATPGAASDAAVGGGAGHRRLGSEHGAPGAPIRPARALRGRHGGPARRADLLPPGPRGRAPQRRAGEEPGAVLAERSTDCSTGAPPRRRARRPSPPSRS